VKSIYKKIFPEQKDIKR